jgi:hypothetical protein
MDSGKNGIATTPKVQMGSGFSPPRVTKHIKRANQTATPASTLGGGIAPPRVVKHIKRVADKTPAAGPTQK